MDFDFTEDQSALRDLTREFLGDRVTIEHVRAMMDDEVGFDRDLYRQLVQLGLMTFPEEYGGNGMGTVGTAILMEEAGRIPYPGPLFATAALAGPALIQSGDEDAMARYLPDAANGDLILSFAFLEEGKDWVPETVNLSLKKDGDSYVLNGTKRFVPWGHVADVTFVAVRSSGSGEDGVSLIAVPKDADGLDIQKEVMLDLNSRTATMVFNDVRVPAENLIGEEGKAWPGIDKAIQHAAVAASAEMLGASQRALEMSVDYAKVRKQFGQVIGQFQAIKHKLAEMLKQVESAFAAVYYAAWALDADASDAALAVSVAKSTVNEGSKQVCGEAIQVHGGIGFTWEYDLHLYWKRAKHQEVLYGSTDQHRERVLDEVLAGRVAG